MQNYLKDWDSNAILCRPQIKMPWPEASCWDFLERRAKSSCQYGTYFFLFLSLATFHRSENTIFTTAFFSLKACPSDYAAPSKSSLGTQTLHQISVLPFQDKKAALLLNQLVSCSLWGKCPVIIFMAQPNLRAEWVPLMRSDPSPNGMCCLAGPAELGSHPVDTRGQVAGTVRDGNKKTETSTGYWLFWLFHSCRPALCQPAATLPWAQRDTLSPFHPTPCNVTK